jgi:hypothetical protein
MQRRFEGRAADVLCLAATPSFAALALLTTVMDLDPAALLCTSGSPFGSMELMYLLMSVFHAAPWLRLLSGR